MPILTGKTMFPRLGRIGAGYMTSKQRDDGSVAIFPAKAKTFVFHVDDVERAEEIAKVFGGKVEAAVSKDEEGGRFRVITQTTEIECFVPSADESGWDCWLEQWGTGGIIRRCDGVTTQMAVVEVSDGDVRGNPNKPGLTKTVRNVPCMCQAEGRPEKDRCDPTSRLNLVIPALKDVPGIGVFQMQSRGRLTWREIDGTIQLLGQLGKIAGVPMVLKLEYRTVRDADGKPRDVPVMWLDSRLSMADAMRQARVNITDEVETRKALPAPDRGPMPGAVQYEEPVDAEIVPNLTEADGHPGGPEPVPAAPQEPPVTVTPGQEPDRAATLEDRKGLHAWATGKGITRNVAQVEIGRMFPGQMTTEGLTVSQLTALRRRFEEILEGK